MFHFKSLHLSKAIPKEIIPMSLNPSQNESLLLKIDQFLDQNLEDENYGVAELVSSMAVSRTQLHRKLKSITGKSTSGYIREYRLKKAHEMLKNDVATASEIAYRVGFSSPSYFSTAFRNFYGYPPGEAKSKKEIIELEDKKSKLPLWITLGALVFVLLGYGLYNSSMFTTSEESSSIELPEIKEKTIAVLAFEDLSEDQSQKYMGMGLAVEVINILDEVEGLKVIGKTSAFSFLDKKITIDSIAELLNVNYVLEGTISESDETIEIVAILSDGGTGQTLSSSRYTSSKDEVSTIKSKIAKQVSYELKIKINEDVILSSGRNEAKLLALEQRAFYRKSKGASVKEAIDIWEECLSIDSTYMPCLAYRSLFTRSAEEHLSYVHKLEALDTSNTYTYYVKGNYFFERELDFQNAYLNYKKMFETDVLDTRIMSEAAFRLGHFDIKKGIEYLKISMEKDPLYSETYSNLAHLYLLDGQYKKSTELLLARMTMTDGYYPWETMFINIYGGYFEDAEMALSEFLANSGPGMNLEYMTLITEMFLAAGRKDDLNFEKISAQVIEMGLEPFPLASAFALYGDHDRSFEWLEKGYEMKSMRFFQELRYAPWFSDMRKDPRWNVLMVKLSMPGYENDEIKV